MSAGQPKWRQAYDALDRELSPRVTELIQSDRFNAALGLVGRARKGIGDQAGAAAARVWHLANLPAGSDVRKLRQQIGALDREVRRLTLQLERERREKE